MNWFDSRWVKCPNSVQETSGLPQRFNCAGVNAGIKNNDDLDFGVIVSETPTVSAVKLTQSSVVAAPIQVMRTQTQLSSLCACVVNSGNANCATGETGLHSARFMQSATAALLRLPSEQVGVASTGIIGVPLERALLQLGIKKVAAALPGSVNDFSQAICTTDRFTKEVSVSIDLPQGVVKLSAQAKGAGMISPAFATMLCFIQTDAILTVSQADNLLTQAVSQSFERISVDGQLSTNDTVILMANGASDVRIESDSQTSIVFSAALKAVLKQLAILMVRDGEGARRVGRIEVHGSLSDQCERVARAVANSPLVKTALYGGDPNWGRIAGAVGQSLPAHDPLKFDIWIEGIHVFANGAKIDFDHAKLAQVVQKNEIEYLVQLPNPQCKAEVFFSDLSYEYIRVNAEYTT